MTRPSATPLVNALASGDSAAYAALYDRLGRSLLRVARAMLKSDADAEDAVQDVFLQLARRRELLVQVADLDAYVFTMLRHTAGQMAQRRQQERQQLSHVPPPVASDSERAVADDLDLALGRLPVEQREVIALKLDGDLTFAQIGEVLNISPNTAASRYRYAIARLRQSLE
jgi:RNA polymerase sigma-70 factor (ECF subfamily)